MRGKERVRDKAAAEYAGLSVATFRNYRLRGGGPPFIKIGGKRGPVLYDLDDVDKWLSENTSAHTSELAR